MASETAELLRQHGIKPSAQRIAVADFVLNTDCHPTADRVLQEAERRCPMVSRATVYNVLNLLTKTGLLRQHALSEGRVVFDPNLAPHHHFVDDETGEIHDLPAELLEVHDKGLPRSLDVREMQVVVRGRQRSTS